MGRKRKMTSTPNAIRQLHNLCESRVYAVHRHYINMADYIHYTYASVSQSVVHTGIGVQRARSAHDTTMKATAMRALVLPQWQPRRPNAM